MILLWIGLEPHTKGEHEKRGAALQHLMAHDPSLAVRTANDGTVMVGATSEDQLEAVVGRHASIPRRGGRQERMAPRRPRTPPQVLRAAMRGAAGRLASMTVGVNRSGESYVLTSPRLRLRSWREEDLGPFAALNADPRVREFFPSIQTRDESVASMQDIQDHFRRHGFGLWAIEVIGGASFIGFTGLTIPSFKAPFMPCVELGYRLAREHWGRGYATEGSRAALAFGFRTIGLTEIVAMTATGNLRSRRVMERLGMTHDPADDFDHPNIARGHPLRRHVLYRLAGNDWMDRLSSARVRRRRPRDGQVRDSARFRCESPRARREPMDASVWQVPGRDRLCEWRVECAECRRIDADAERQAENDVGREARIAPQHSGGVRPLWCAYGGACLRRMRPTALFDVNSAT